MDNSKSKSPVPLFAALKALLKGPMNFAFGLKDDEAGMLLHRTRSAATLGLQLKKEQQFKKVAFGVASAEGRLLVLDVAGPPLSGMRKRVLRFFRENKLTTFNDVKVMSGGVEAVDEDGKPAATTAPPTATATASVPASVSTTQVTATLTAAKNVWPPAPPISRRPVTSTENDALAKLPPAKLREQNLTQRDPKGLFTEKYMAGLVGLKVQGANDKRLKEIMRQLAKGVTPAERKSLIAELAKIRGVPAAQLDAQYDRFMILRAQQEAVRQVKNEEVVPDLAEDMHKEFMASNPQLVFGKVVGDAFGVDPVFGALLSPTGGMVGPGNKALHLDDDDPTGYHGIVHDAAGYLFNYHNQGPGYDYLGKEASKGHLTSDPLTGQQSGMRYWHEKLDPGVGTVLLTGTIDTVYAAKDLPMNIRKGAELLKERTTKTVTEFKVKADQALASARQTVGDAMDKALHAASEKKQEAATALEKAAHEAADAARAARDRVTETASTSLESAKRAVGAASDEAAAKLNAAWDSIWS